MSIDPNAAALLEGLNPEQREAVETTEGPLLVVAGAGSGKTRVLTHRIAYLVGGCGIDPEAILAVTFTNKAAAEMRERVAKLLGLTGDVLWVSTFHSTCVRLLRREIHHLGRSRSFVIYDESDSLAVVKESLRRHGLDPKSQDAQRLRWRIDQWKNAARRPDDIAQEAHDLDGERMAEVYATYQKLLAEAEALDFNDLLLETTRLFDEHPEVLETYRRRWQYLLVDEYQDTNRVQYRLLSQLAAGHRNLCVVGDPDQSVYAWRGADIRNILDFEKEFPDAGVVKLERNYRSTQPILAGASAVIENNLERKQRRLVTDREGGEPIRLFEAGDDRIEAQYVVRELLEATRESGRPLGECAIFYRTNAQSRTFEEELLKYDLPYVVVGGVRFYDRAEIKDALAYLRVLVNPKDDQGLRRIVNTPARGIGKTTLEKAAALAARSGGSLLDGLRAFAGDGGARSAAKVRSFLATLDGLARDLPHDAPADAIGLVLERSGYLAALEREGTPEAEARTENLRELLSSADDFTALNAPASEGAEDDRSLLAIFLDQVALVSDLDAYENRSDRVSLMTVHSAKGLEFPIVFLVGLEEGVFPPAASSRDPDGIEEERRLCYVGMTRAMERLTMTYARERRRFGQRLFGAPSRFLREIPASVVTGSDPHGEGLGDAGGAGVAGFGRGGPGGRSGSGGQGGLGERSVDYSYGQWSDDETPLLRPGLRVRHPVFGAGSVVAVRGQGSSQKLDIRFDRAGVKTVMVRFANLELG